MGSLSNYLELELLDHVLKTGAYTQPTNVQLALSTADPTDSGSGLAEPSGNGYARVTHNAWDVASSRATANTGVATFPQATGSWGTISHFAIFDDAGTPNMLAHGVLTTPRAVGNLDTPRFDGGDITVTFNANGFANFLAHELLDHVFKTGAYTAPTNLYVALCDAATADTQTGSTISEPAGGSYARKLHNAWDTAAAGASENTGAITFVEATGSWGTITNVAVTDALTLGNLLLHAALTTSKSVSSGETAEFADGDLDVTLD